ncbi:hypothetical protein HPB52_022944 [Rhipicephalus sanguineus]|uniref:Uncharacterized protein n=1 Tax=Rhipicephalus sanguineus TaxID=34632 RepID=A0A9D4PPJ7_RHISA|nr:hypothetical protein HPB52_022944 [Rhipicephalus sanguineus]
MRGQAMDEERFFALGRELGLEKAELREWEEKESALARDERVREREDAKESAERQRQLQERELRILELKLKLQESAGRQSVEAGQPGGSAASTTRAPEGMYEEMASNGTTMWIVAAIDLAMAEFATGCDALPRYTYPTRPDMVASGHDAQDTTALMSRATLLL